MSGLIVLALLMVLDIAALLWGHDSRDGRDWSDEHGHRVYGSGR
jgi:hypothetical protein